MQTSTVPDFPFVILGAGFAGIGMGIKLKKAGILSFTIFERASEVGGTWRDNTYPGCACDVQSDVYSFSFELNPDWSRRFSPWNEIRDYLIRCTDKYGLRPHLSDHLRQDLRPGRRRQLRSLHSRRRPGGELRALRRHL